MHNMYLQRRKKLFEKMQENSALIIFAAQEVTRSADTEYPFRQNSDFWYFTGFNEPNAALLLVKKAGVEKVILFNRVKDPLAEIWNGKRLGQEAAIASLNVDEAYAIEDLHQTLLGLINRLQAWYVALGEYRFADIYIENVLNQLRKKGKENYRAPISLIDWRPIVHEMRLIKSDDEIAIMEKACQITALAHNEAMKQCRPERYEYELEGEILYQFNMNGARYPSYNTIVGGGANGCILHYTENDQRLIDGDLVLIDAGCEFQGYAGDITRTFPVNGRFTVAQREIYDLVLKAQKLALDNFRPGVSVKEVNALVVDVFVNGLVQLGILHGDVNTLINDGAYKTFYMHGLGHWLGLDVHDVGDYDTPERSRTLVPGMVLTVEPGLYIAASKDVPEKYWNIGVRIEDNIVITENGNRVLTIDAIKEPDEIEALMNKGN